MSLDFLKKGKKLSSLEIFDTMMKIAIIPFFLLGLWLQLSDPSSNAWIIFFFYPFIWMGGRKLLERSE